MPGNGTRLASQAPAQCLFAERFRVRGVLRNNLKSKGSSYANPQQLAARRKWLTLCLLFPVRHLCARSLQEGERGIFSNRVCLQTDPADCFPFTVSSLEGKKGAHSGRLHFTWGERCFSPGKWPSSNWGEGSRVRCVMTNAPGAHHLSCRVNKELQNPLGSEPCLTCCGCHQRHVGNTHLVQARSPEVMPNQNSPLVLNFQSLHRAGAASLDTLPPRCLCRKLPPLILQGEETKKWGRRRETPLASWAAALSSGQGQHPGAEWQIYLWWKRGMTEGVKPQRRQWCVTGTGKGVAGAETRARQRHTETFLSLPRACRGAQKTTFSCTFLRRAEILQGCLRTAPNAMIRRNEHWTPFFKKNQTTNKTNLIPSKEQLHTKEGEILINTSGSLWQHLSFTKSALAASGCPLKRSPCEQREKLECTQTSRGQMFLLMRIFSPQCLGHSGQLFAVVAAANLTKVQKIGSWQFLL